MVQYKNSGCSTLNVIMVFWACSQCCNLDEIESQLMNRFLNDNASSTFVYPDEFQEDFNPVYESVNTSRLAGSDLETTTAIHNSFTLILEQYFL